MRKRVWPLVLSALISVMASKAIAAPSTLASADWSVKAPRNLAKYSPSRKAVEELLDLGDTTASSPSLCSFIFADLRHTGTLSLVAASDSSGRRFCNDIDIVDRTEFGFESSGPPPTEIGQGIDVSNLIQDISGDGRGEVVVQMGVGGYQGGVHCGLEWPVIYAWTGTGYANLSNEFKGYYRQHLAELKRQINGGSATPVPEEAEKFESQPTDGGGPRVKARYIKLPQAVAAPTSAVSAEPNSVSSHDEYRMDCLKAEAAKTERFRGISSDAGMADAIKWSNSDDPLTREFAATIFDDMGTPEALDHLKTLANDPDSSVAAGPQNDLRIRAAQRGPIETYEIESEPWSITGN
jgi:hypothetical protein